MNLALLSKYQKVINPRLKARVQDNSGLTLMEVLIAMTILVFISFAIYQATVETFRLRDTLASEGDFYNSIRLSMTVLERDVSLLYSPLITLPLEKRPNRPNSANPTSANPNDLPPPPNAQQMQSYMADDLNQSSKFWSAAIDASGLRPSRFVGTESKMSFISTSHVRIYRDSPESDFSKITYELKRDEKPPENPAQSSQGSQVLIKTESPNAFSNEQVKDTMVRSYELLHGIKKMSFTYLQRDGNTWKKLSSWDSDREDTKFLYPDLVQVTLEAVGPRNELFEGTFKFKPEIPLNGIFPSL